VVGAEEGEEIRELVIRRGVCGGSCRIGILLHVGVGALVAFWL
jgi:hypothetical protein